MKAKQVQSRGQLEGRQTGGDQTDELFINNPEHPLKAKVPGNRTKEVEYVEGQDTKPHLNPADAIPDDINTRER
ncbi:MAG TPA: hypothetical protein VL995_11630 [Cellvibrio sp.]|nr:hypothetical protein [Cellvibrio sp.]